MGFCEWQLPRPRVQPLSCTANGTTSPPPPKGPEPDTSPKQPGLFAPSKEGSPAGQLPVGLCLEWLRVALEGGGGSLLDPADGLDLGGLGVRAQLPEAPVLASVVVALHYVLEAAVPRKLAAHPAGGAREEVVPGRSPPAPRTTSLPAGLLPTLPCPGGLLLPCSPAVSLLLAAAPQAGEAPLVGSELSPLPQSPPPSQAGGGQPARLSSRAMGWGPSAQHSEPASFTDQGLDPPPFPFRISELAGLLPPANSANPLGSPRQLQEGTSPPTRFSCPPYLRASVDPEGAHLAAAPAHGSERGVVLTQVSLAAQEVLLFKDGHLAVPVVLRWGGGEREGPTLFWGSQPPPPWLRGRECSGAASPSWHSTPQRSLTAHPPALGQKRPGGKEGSPALGRVSLGSPPGAARGTGELLGWAALGSCQGTQVSVPVVGSVGGGVVERRPVGCACA